MNLATKYLELLMKVVIQRGVKDWVSHGRGYTNKVTEEVGEH